MKTGRGVKLPRFPQLLDLLYDMQGSMKDKSCYAKRNTSDTKRTTIKKMARAGVSSREISEETGVSKSTVARYMREAKHESNKNIECD